MAERRPTADLEARLPPTTAPTSSSIAGDDDHTSPSGPTRDSSHTLRRSAKSASKASAEAQRNPRSSARQVGSSLPSASDSASPSSNLPGLTTNPPATAGIKRKSTEQDSTSPSQPPAASVRSKRHKGSDTLVPLAVSEDLRRGAKRKGKRASSAMEDSSPPSARPTSPDDHDVTPSATSSRKSSRSKKSNPPHQRQAAGKSINYQRKDGLPAYPVATDSTTASSSSLRRTKRQNAHPADQDTTMTGMEDRRGAPGPPPPRPPPPAGDRMNHDSDEDDHDPDDDERHDPDDDEDDEDEDEDDLGPFGGFGGPGGMAGISQTLRALSGMMSGLNSRLRGLLDSLRSGDMSMQMVALNELAELLLVSNEDNLSGHFAPDAFVKELVKLMNKEESPEIMLVACRCLANMMEALPASVANVVYGGAVPVLCQKLLEISFIDLAEQSLSTLEKISAEYPANIVREGGLTACLSFLDFFPTSVQRTAVTTAANCCRNIPDDSFAVVRDVMPNLLNVLGSNDQRVVDQAALCVSGIVESFKYQPAKLEELVSTDLLRAILRLLVPGTTNTVRSNIHTQFLRVLSFSARASPKLSTELFKLNVVETLYQILTGVSPPAGTDDVASKLDSVVVMQALIHRPRDQILETLNVICELLPKMGKDDDFAIDPFGHLLPADLIAHLPAYSRRTEEENDKRVKLLTECHEEVRRFALIIFPTLTDAFSSTVNLAVRQKVLIAQLKMLSNLDEKILAEALVSVPYASFLASILSQQDHPSLVRLGLWASDLLVKRLDHIYRYQFYREGVFNEIHKLAEQEPDADEEDKTKNDHDHDEDRVHLEEPASPHRRSGDDEETEDETDEPYNETQSEGDRHSSDEDNTEDHHDDDGDVDLSEDEGDQEPEIHVDEGLAETVSSHGSTMSLDGPSHAQMLKSHKAPTGPHIRETAQRFIKLHENEAHGKEMKTKATSILETLTTLAGDLKTLYLDNTTPSQVADKGAELFTKLASHFDTDVLESVTSAELLDSGLVDALLSVFSNPDESLARAAQATFLEVFMGHTVRAKPKTATADSPVTPFSIMIHKLQDLLSRSEHFEVMTVHQNAHDYDGHRNSPAAMLGKQLKLSLVADDESNIPRHYRSIMVSIHAIATLKSLEEFLRTRINESERPKNLRRDGLSRALAALGGDLALAGGRSSRFVDPSSLFSGLPPPPPAPPGTSGSTRSARHPARRTSQHAESSDTPGQAGSSSRDRQLARREASPLLSTPTTRPPPTQDDEPEDTLECADEKPMEDDDEDDQDLQAFVRALRDGALGGQGMPEEEGEEEDEEEEEALTGESPSSSDPSAVNMEVATGGNVTARKEDGTKVATPSGSALPSRTSTSTPTPARATRPGQSYASAVRAPPQDWHIQFTTGEKVIPNETTVYRAVHLSGTGPDNQLPRNVWSSTHPIKFRRVKGPAPAASAAATTLSDNDQESEDGIPASLAKHPSTSAILRLLKILHVLNSNTDDVLSDDKELGWTVHIEPASQFVNTKLTAKLNRQMEEPLIVASGCLPSWTEDLSRLYPFLFPFETRHLFLQSTSFGYARSMSRWNQQTAEDRRHSMHDRPYMGRLQRQKVRISRVKLLESAVKVMDLYGSAQSILEVEYFEEVGTGLGPTLEFYSNVSKEFSKKKLKLWREMDSSSSEFISGPTGLFPRPMNEEELSNSNGERILHLFKMLGKFVARSMIDSRIIDLHFNPIFFRIGETEAGAIKPSLGAVKVVDPGLARSLKTIKKFALAKKQIDEDSSRTPAQKVSDAENITIDDMKLDDLCLDFSLPGYPEIELEADGANKRVTIDNVDQYLELVVDLTLGRGVQRQVDAFRTGFSLVFPYTALSAFTPAELVNLFGRADEDWSIETLGDSIKADHGFNMDSATVKNLLQTMSKFKPEERREFLQFITGSPKLPIGGFKSLQPLFTVVCKPAEDGNTPDHYLPSVMTCVNYLKLPNYSSPEVLEKRLMTAMKEGQGAFHLS